MQQEQSTVRPVTLKPIIVERVWGSDDLSAWYPQPEPGKPVGEVWLTAEQCVADDGEETLAELAVRHPAAFGNESQDGFPLLIKMLYPREKLSVQVHPDDAAAKAMLGQPRGKTECWYILSAEPGAKVAVGFAAAMTTADVRTAIEDSSLESKLRTIEVQAGDMIFVDAGTVHAIGPGMMVLEIQQYSDVTYRLWDYGRPRELHVEQGLSVTKFLTHAGLTVPVAMPGHDRLIDCEYFTVDRFRLDQQMKPLGCMGDLQILIPLGSDVLLTIANETHSLRAGCATLLPAGAAEAYITAGAAGVDVMRILGAS